MSSSKGSVELAFVVDPPTDDDEDTSKKAPTYRRIMNKLLKDVTDATCDALAAAKKSPFADIVSRLCKRLGYDDAKELLHAIVLAVLVARLRKQAPLQGVSSRVYNAVSFNVGQRPAVTEALMSLLDADDNQLAYMHKEFKTKIFGIAAAPKKDIDLLDATDDDDELAQVMAIEVAEPLDARGTIVGDVTACRPCLMDAQVYVQFMERAKSDAIERFCRAPSTENAARLAGTHRTCQRIQRAGDPRSVPALRAAGSLVDTMRKSTATKLLRGLKPQKQQLILTGVDADDILSEAVPRRR